MSIGRLRELVAAFELVYHETGAAAEINLRNPETGAESDAILTYRAAAKNSPAGLFVSMGGGHPVPVIDAPPAVMARAAQHLPQLAKTLDVVAALIDGEVAAGLHVLEPWITERGSGGSSDDED